ncbi:hypothetical protein WHR41_08986 [Cladosporium halotolerans]|uniref:Vacuolar protein sorting-associated protein 51 homolog n=1 Tax=Cladosporium halotolerans TaxID=1052096 RepID=A0AB34KB07_9PEZI
MSTIASPRPSIALSSRRTSTSTDRSASLTRQPGSAAPGNQRRNRAALRDYYGLKADPKPSSRNASPAPPPLDPELESELDKPGFSSTEYVSSLLASSDLETVMRTVASLASEIRSLDGEKKALVYDNYSKLISATETIARMRASMEPLTPATATLAPAVEHIAETSAALSGALREQHGSGSGSEAERKAQEQRATVRWVLDAPGRLRGLIDAGKREDAEEEWKKVSGLLDKWETVAGVQEVRKACEEAMKESGD